MSYVRMGSDGSDVYVFMGSEGLECCWCRLDTVHPPIQRRWGTTSLSAMLAHLREHREAGHCVPDFVFERLEWELEKYGDHVDKVNEGLDAVIARLKGLAP